MIIALMLRIFLFLLMISVLFTENLITSHVIDRNKSQNTLVTVQNRGLISQEVLQNFDGINSEIFFFARYDNCYFRFFLVTEVEKGTKKTAKVFLKLMKILTRMMKFSIKFSHFH